MEDRVKERLTGAVILVALVVGLIPELFHGETAESQLAAPAAGDGLPLRSYTIDLDQQASSADGQVGADNTAKSMVVTEVATIASSPANAGAPSVQLASAAVLPSGPVAVAPAAAATQVAAVEPMPASRPTRTSGTVGWVVQVGTFSKRENADKLVTNAASKGVDLAVAGPDARGLYRVRTRAVVADRQAAAALQGQLKSQGFSGMVNASQ